MESPPRKETRDPVDRSEERLDSLIPAESSQPYDIKEIIAAVVDDGHFLEVQALFARNIVVGFARLGGRSVGMVANQPAVLAGCLDIDASIKAARFVRFCDAFNIPLICFEDVPGFLPGTSQGVRGDYQAWSQVALCLCGGDRPKITVITRKAYGGAYCVMASKHLRTDVNLAYPTAEIAVMGPDGAVRIVYRKELAAAADLEAERPGAWRNPGEVR